LNITKKTNYVIIDGIDDFSFIPGLIGELKNTGSDEGVYAIVFNVCREFSLTSVQKEKLLELPYITVLYSSDFSGMSLENMMFFDIRMSERPFLPQSSESETADMARFEMLFGRKRTYEFKNSACSGEPSADGYGIVKVVPENGYEAYMDRLFKEKSESQTDIITKALISFRQRGKQACSDEESAGFYNLIKERAGE